ncbi:unnamed protein product [Closterium sp. NIES-64]|nr:unnamed protein product [Closterium sp. NIES-64]
MRDVRPTVENHRCVSRLSLRNAPILPCPFTPNTTRSSQFSLPEAHSVHAAFFSSRPFLPYPPRRIQCPVRFRCALPSLPSRRFIRGGLVLFTLPCALRPAHPVLFSHARRFALFLPSASPVIVVPSLSFPSHSLIPCAILLIPLSFPPQTLIPCAFTLIPLSFSHSVRLHSHSPLILSFRAPSLSFPSHSLIPCAFTLIPLSFSHSVRLHSHSPLILSFRAPSLSFPSHSPLILSFRAPSLSFPSHSLFPCAFALIPLSVSHSVRHPSQSLFPCAFTLIPLSFSHSVRHPSHSPLILSFRASSLSFPSHSLIPCAFTLLPLSFSLRVCLPSHSPLNLSFRAPSLSFPSHSLIPCAFTRIPLYSSSHVRVLSSPSGSLLTCAISLFPLMRVCPIPLCSAPPVRMLPLSPLRLSAHAQFVFFPSAPLPPLRLLARSPLSLFSNTSDTSSSSDSVDSVQPFEQDDDASSNAAVSGADDDGGEGAQAGVALAEEEDAPQFNLKDALARRILSNRLSISQINALLEILRKTILEIQDWKSYQDDLLKNPKLAAKMVFHADPQYVGNVRVYSNPETGLWWERLQTLVREEDPDGVVAALILASDETHMDHRGKAKGHPVYLTLGNIDKDDRWQPSGHVLLALLPEFLAEYNVVDKMQVHNYIMREVLQSLKTASYTGMAMKNAVGESINVWPYLYAYVSDYPESCKITCTKSLGTLFPCSICKVDKKHLAVLQDRIQARTPFEQDTIVRDILEGWLALDAEATFSTHPVQSFLGGWRWESDTILNPYLAVLPDVMHQEGLGIYEHIVDFIRAHVKLMADRKKLDRILRSTGNSPCQLRLMRSIVACRTTSAPCPCTTVVNGFLMWRSKLGDDILTEENKRRQLAKEAALKTAAVNTLHGAPTVGKTAAAGRRGGSKRKRAAAGSGASGRSSSANGNIPVGSPSADNPTAGTSSEAEGANPALVAEAMDTTQNGAPTTRGIVCGIASDADIGALPAPPVPAAGAPGPMMAVVIEAAEEGGVDPFIAYGIEAGSDDEDGNYDDADDVDGVQAGNDDELRAVEVRAAEVCAAKVRAVEVRAAELRAAELRAAELRAAEIRAAEIRAAEIRAAEVRAVEDRAAAVRAADVRSAEARQTELAPHTSQPNNPTAPVRREMEFYPLWEEFQPHLVRKYIAEGTTQDEYYLFMGGNSKRIDRALKVIGCKRANMNKPIKL